MISSNICFMRKIKHFLRKYSSLSQCLRNNDTESLKVNNKLWRVLFFGTDEFALESLKKLHKELTLKKLSRLETVTAYRGRENEVLKFAKNRGIKVHSWPLDKNELADFDIGLVVSFGHLIPSWIINSFPLGMFNVHASLLPRWRGAAPVIYSLMNGDTQTGVTLMKIMPKKFDVGEILAQREISIGPDETQPELYKRLANIGGDLLIESLREFPNLLSSGRRQMENYATYAPKVRREISMVRWTEMTAKQVYDLQRALTGIYHLTTIFQNIIIKIFNIKLHPEIPKNINAYHLTPGIVSYDKINELLLIKCNDNKWVSVREISIPGRRKMSAKDFNNGFIMNRNEKFVIFEMPAEPEASKSYLQWK